MKTSFILRRSTRNGFTLLEIMIVVVIVGMLASMAITAMNHARQRSIAIRVANDLRIFGDAFSTRLMEAGAWPVDGMPGEVPAGMDGYLATTWNQGTPAGGLYDWDQGVFGVEAAVSVDSPTVESELLEEIDRILDDGSLATGRLRTRTGGIMYVLEE